MLHSSVLCVQGEQVMAQRMCLLFLSVSPTQGVLEASLPPTPTFANTHSLKFQTKAASEKGEVQSGLP